MLHQFVTEFSHQFRDCLYTVEKAFNSHKPGLFVVFRKKSNFKHFFVAKIRVFLLLLLPPNLTLCQTQQAPFLSSIPDSYSNGGKIKLA